MRKQHQTTLALLRIFYQCQIYNKNTFSWMSIETVMKRLLKGYGINIGYAAVRWQIQKLVEQGLLVTFPTKYRREPDGTIYAITPNRSVTLPGAKWLRKAGIYIFSWLWKHLTREEILPRGKGRASYERPPMNEQPPDQTPEGVLKLLPEIGKSFS